MSNSQREQNITSLQVVAGNHDAVTVKGEMVRSFVLKSSSTETRRTYRNTLNEFAAFCQRRRAVDELAFADVTVDDCLAWRDLLIKANERAHTVSTKLAIIRSLFEYGRARGVFERNPAISQARPFPEETTSQSRSCADSH